MEIFDKGGISQMKRLIACSTAVAALLFLAGTQTSAVSAADDVTSVLAKQGYLIKGGTDLDVSPSINNPNPADTLQKASDVTDALAKQGYLVKGGNDLDAPAMPPPSSPITNPESANTPKDVTSKLEADGYLIKGGTDLDASPSATSGKLKNPADRNNVTAKLRAQGYSIVQIGD
jgi:hypothetical protein